MKKKKQGETPAPAPVPATAPAPVRARITTDRGPFWQERPLKRNEVVEIPPALFAVLQGRGWAVEA
jgi:hypothetical protein